MQNTRTPILKKILTASLLVSAVGLSGCQWFKVYTMDLPQGTPITAQKASQVAIGMNQAEVLYILGSPALKDPLSPNRWDYLYDYTAGTDGKRAKKPNIHNANQYLRVYFNDSGTVIRLEGVETLPNK